MSLINFGAGLSELGKSVASYAGQAGMMQEKSSLENQQAILADQLKEGSDVKLENLRAANEQALVPVQGAQAIKTAQASAEAQGKAQITTAQAENALPMSDAQQAHATSEQTEAEAAATQANKPISVTPGSELVDRNGKPLFKSQGAALSDAALDRMADQALAGDRSVFTGLGYGNVGATNRAALAERITQKGKERGLNGADVAALNAQYTGIQAGERSLGTRSANIGMASQEFQMMAPLGLKASENVDRTKYPTLNAVDQAFEKGTGDESVVRLGAATNSLVNIYARAINPTGTPTDSDKAHARDILDKAYSKGQYAAAVDQLQQEISAAMKAPGAVRSEMRDAITGNDSSTNGGSTAQTSGPKIPPLPAGVPSGSQYSASRNAWRDPNGNIYNADGSKAK